MDCYRTLNYTKPGETVTISRILSEKHIRQRLLDLGFVDGTSIKCVLKQRNGEIAAYLVRGTTIALRKEDAQRIVVF